MSLTAELLISGIRTKTAIDLCILRDKLYLDVCHVGCRVPPSVDEHNCLGPMKETQLLRT